MMRWSRDYIVAGAFLAGGILVAHGFLNYLIDRYIVDSVNVFEEYGVIFGATILFSELAARIGICNRISAGAIFVSLIAIVSGLAWPLVVTILFFLSSYLLGRILKSGLKIQYLKGESASCLLLGAAVYGTGFGLLAHFPVIYKGIVFLLLIAPLFYRRDLVIGCWYSIRDLAVRESSHKFLDLGIAALVALFFCVAMMPELGYDALAMHLFAAGYIAEWREWGFDVSTYVWAAMPMLGDWIFSITYVLAGEQAARFTNVGFIVLLAFMIRDLVVWAGGNDYASKWAVLIFLTTPLTLLEGSSLFIESVWGSFIVAGILVLLKMITDPESRAGERFLILGVLLGAGLAAKAVTLTILPVLFVLFLIGIGFSRVIRNLNGIAIGCTILLIFGLIPYITAWIITDNPIFPFYNGYFKSPLWLPINFQAPPFEKGLNWSTLYNVTFRTERFLESRSAGSGFQWLLLLVPAFVGGLFFRQYRSLILIVVGLSLLAITFYMTAYLRYVFPSAILLIAGIGAALFGNAGYSALLSRTIAVFGIATIVLNMIFIKSASSTASFSPNVLRGTHERELYLSDRLPVRNAVSLINQINIERSPVAVFSMPLVAGLRADALHPNWYNYRFQSIINHAKTERALIDMLADYKVEYVILDVSWGDDEKRKLIMRSTESVVDLGQLSIRKIRTLDDSDKELLINTGFKGSAGWSFTSDAAVADGVQVSVDHPVTQSVPVISGAEYNVTVKAMCYNGHAEGRLQVNWMDVNSQFIDTNIQVYECSQDAGSYSMKVKAPKNALYAVVYAVGHTTKPILIKSVSFR